MGFYFNSWFLLKLDYVSPETMPKFRWSSSKNYIIGLAEYILVFTMSSFYPDTVQFFCINVFAYYVIFYVNDFLFTFLKFYFIQSWLIGKDSDAGKDWGQEEKGTTEDEMAGWHHGLDGRESEWTPGDGDGQGGLACCSSWGCKESDTTERLNWTEAVVYKKLSLIYYLFELNIKIHVFLKIILYVTSRMPSTHLGKHMEILPRK